MNLSDITVYCINDEDLPNDLYMSDITDDEFVMQAEKVGTFYTLPEFQEAFNNAEISDQWYIRILKTKSQF